MRRREDGELTALGEGAIELSHELAEWIVTLSDAPLLANVVCVAWPEEQQDLGGGARRRRDRFWALQLEGLEGGERVAELPMHRMAKQDQVVGAALRRLQLVVSTRVQLDRAHLPLLCQALGPDGHGTSAHEEYVRVAPPSHLRRRRRPVHGGHRKERRRLRGARKDRPVEPVGTREAVGERVRHPLDRQQPLRLAGKGVVWHV